MRYSVALHERILTVVDTEKGHSRAPKTARRGNIKGISSKSRYRLIKLLAKINRPDEPLFITLTYRSFTDVFADWKRHLDNFRRVLADDFPELAAVWRLEFQKRGAPHFHILLWLGVVRLLSEVEARLTEIWTRVIGQREAANVEHGCEVVPVTDFRKSAFYISVYQAKDGQDRDDIATGREWGVWGRKRLGFAPIQNVPLTRPQFLLFRRTLRGLYVSHLRVTGKGLVGDTGKKRGYLAALESDQPFSNFLPFQHAARLVRWCVSERPNLNPF